MVIFLNWNINIPILAWQLMKQCNGHRISGIIWVIVQPQQRPVLIYPYFALQWSMPVVSGIPMRLYISRPLRRSSNELLDGCCLIMEGRVVECWLNWAGQHCNICCFISRLIFFTRSFMKFSPWPSQCTFYLPNIQPDNIIAITSLSLVIRPRHIRRAFTPELSEIGMIYRIHI